ncbi:MAG: hypothetical protein GY861_26680 [bacterium]|nr:hypothetical protein [bacterium]
MIELFTLKKDRVEFMEHSSVSRTLTWTKIVGGKNTVWMRCLNPNEETIAVLSEVSKIPVEEFRESMEEEERPKLSMNRYLEIVYRAPEIEEGDVVTVPVYIYIVNNLIITIEKSKNSILDGMSNGMKANKKRFLFKKPIGYFIFLLLDQVNDDFLKYIDRIGAKVDVFAEKKALSTETVEKIYDSSVTLSYFNQALIANIEVVNNLRKCYYKTFSDEDRKRFSELYFDALQIMDTEKIQRDVISNLFNMQAVINADRLNNFMKTIAFFALIIMLPTLITGMYGMNINNLPLANNPYAFYILLAVMLVLVMGLFYAFKRTVK